MQNRNMSFDEMDNYGSKRTPFFNLADDGDKAVIRFYHENGDDIQKLPVHSVTVDDRKIKVVCLREPGGSESDCPLCENGSPVSPKMFIKILVYTPDKAGYYTGKPTLQIWERGRSFRKQLQSLINRYATNKPLMDTVFEIERCGKKGDNTTTYQIYKMDVEPDECKLPDPDDIEDFDALGTIVKDKSYEDMETYVRTGKFPITDNKKSSSNRDVSPARTARNETRVQEDDYDENAQENEMPVGRRVRNPEDTVENRRPPRRV